MEIRGDFKTAIDKFFLYDKQLSWKAKGMLYFMISHEHEYTFTKKLLISYSSCRRMSVDSGLEELQKYGYLKFAETGDILLKIPKVGGLYQVAKQKSDNVKQIYNRK